MGQLVHSSHVVLSGHPIVLLLIDANNLHLIFATQSGPQSRVITSRTGEFELFFFFARLLFIFARSIAANPWMNFAHISERSLASKLVKVVYIASFLIIVGVTD